MVSAIHWLRIVSKPVRFYGSSPIELMAKKNLLGNKLFTKDMSLNLTTYSDSDTSVIPWVLVAYRKNFGAQNDSAPVTNVTQVNPIFNQIKLFL